MRHTARILNGGLIPLAVSLLVGCGAGSKGTVTGSATYDGKPIEKGTVVFLPADGKGSIVSGEIVDGRFSVRNVPPGKKQVQITALDTSQEAQAQTKQYMQEAAKVGAGKGVKTKPKFAVKLPGALIPPGATKDLTADISGGDQTVNFNVPKIESGRQDIDLMPETPPETPEQAK